MQAIFETLFDVIYLSTVIILGIKMIRKSKKQSLTFMFGVMALLLGVGDAFHLVPRSYGLLTIGLEANVVALGIGKLITSITMTIFYILLFYIWKKRYHIEGKKWLTEIIILLGAIRIGLCLFPQNQWTSLDAPISWGIYRNIPFLIMGIIIIALFYQSAKQHKDNVFRMMWLAITLSFAFYIPVVLFAKTIPVIGVLMMPKTIAYVWIVIMGYQTRKEIKEV